MTQDNNINGRALHPRNRPNQQYWIICPAIRSHPSNHLHCREPCWPARYGWAEGTHFQKNLQSEIRECISIILYKVYTFQPERAGLRQINWTKLNRVGCYEKASDLVYFEHSLEVPHFPEQTVIFPERWKEIYSISEKMKVFRPDLQTVCLSLHAVNTDGFKMQTISKPEWVLCSQLCLRIRKIQ